MGKKAILVVSFGTVYLEALAKSVESAENSFAAAFPDYEVRRAFVSSAVIEKLAEKSNVHVDSIGTALKKLADENFEEVYLQPLYVVADKTYQHIREYVIELAHKKEKEFKKIMIGRPMLYSLGLKDHPDDYAIAIEALNSELPDMGGEKAVVLVCNGSNQLEYSVLQLKLADAGIKNVFVCTMEGYPSVASVVRQLKETKGEEVVLVPFLMVASPHVLDYIGGDKPESPKSQLEQAGYRVDLWTKGLGENPAVHAIYIQHLKDALRAMETHHGHHRKAAHGQSAAGHHGHK